MIIYREMTAEEKEMLIQFLFYWVGENKFEEIIREQNFIVGEGQRKELFITNFQTIDFLKKNNSITPYTVGLGFGEFKDNDLQLGLGSLNYIGRHSNKIAVVTHEAEQLFLYKREIYCGSILQINNSLKIGDKVLVMNKDKDVIGIGKLTINASEITKGKSLEQIAIKNLMDIGWYLRKGK